MTETAAAAVPRPTVPAAGDEAPVVRHGGTTADDHRTASRFVLGRPGWRVEARATTRDGAYLILTTPRPGTGGQRFWEVTRTREGLLVWDGATGRRLRALPTMRDALVEVWEAATDAAPD